MSSDSTAGRLIDDEGNLFGVVNVVDALVVLLVLAVTVAGAGLALGNGDTSSAPETGTTFVTLDLGTQPDYIVAALNEGDTYSPTEQSNLTITRLHLAPQDDQTRVIARAQLQGVATEDSITYADAPPRLGRTLDITTSQYEVSGQIRAIGDDSNLSRQSTTVVLQDTMSTDAANEVTPGDEIRLSSRTIATVEDTEIYATNKPNQRTVFVEANLQTYQQLGEHRFGDTQVRRGQTITLPTDQYTINGQIEQVGSGLEEGSTTTRTVTLRMTDIREDMAEAIEPGLTEQAGGNTIARVTNVETQPAVIITTGDNGSVNVVDHPFLRDVTITTELRVRESGSDIQFKGESIRQGSTVFLDLRTVTIEATVVEIGS